jgi:hypothetical protein
MRAMMTRTITLLFLLLGMLWATPAAAQPEADLYGRVNALRSSLGLAPYRRNAALDAAARNQAQWMVTTGEISHTQSDGSTPRVRAQRAGYPSSVVIENIYAGSNASAGTAWSWWLNSPIHYRGITSPNHDEIGIGTASGDWGRAFVLVFGNSTGTWSLSGATVNTSSGGGGASGGGGNNAAAPAAPPVFVVGVDAVGNIMHEIQPGDTLGDIALLYGYTWDDLGYMREINGLDEAAGRSLEIGSVFLVPPQAGTYTPTPGEPSPTPTSTPTDTLTPSPSNTPDGDTCEAANYTAPTDTPTPTPARIATGAAPLDLLALPSATATATATLTRTPQVVADAGQTGDPATFEASRVVVNERGRPAWVWLLIGLQVVIVVAAGVEMIRRQRG